jgi:7,8-dihydropterin-6-yl-methyl-4-(beta-D-ribofuranosyl)aminobenzene 5'-phosphate synthase
MRNHALRQTAPGDLRMQTVDALTVFVVVDNSSDMLSTRPRHIASELRVLISAGMQELTGEGLCSAHQGLSLVVTARLGAQERTILFDAGPDPYALERNVRRMEQLSVQRHGE